MKKILKRIAIVIGVLFALFMAFAIWAVSTAPDKPAEQPKKEVADTTAKQDSQIHLGITAKDLHSKVTARMNKALNANDPIDNIVIEDGKFTVNYHKHFVWGGLTDKDGNATQVYYVITNSDEITAHMLYLLLHMTNTAQVLNPELPEKQIAEQISNMLSKPMKETAETKESASNSVVIGKHNYNIGTMPDIGTVVANISPKE